MMYIIVIMGILALASALVYFSVRSDSYHHPAVALALSAAWVSALSVTAFLAFIWSRDTVIPPARDVTGIVLLDENAGDIQDLQAAYSRLTGKVKLHGGQAVTLSFHSRSDWMDDESFLGDLDGRFPTLQDAYPLIEWVEERYGPVPIAVYSNRYPDWLERSAPEAWTISWIDAASGSPPIQALRVYHPGSVFRKDRFRLRISPLAVDGKWEVRLNRGSTRLASRFIEGTFNDDDLSFEVESEDSASSLYKISLLDNRETVLTEYSFLVRNIERPPVTYVSPFGDGGPLARLLSEEGFELEFKTPADLLTGGLDSSSLTEGALLILDAVPIPIINDMTKRRIADLVSNLGIRLLFIPGSDARKEARGTSVEEILPVIFGYRNPEDTGDSLAFVAVVDASMSMFYTAGGGGGHGMFGENPTGPVSKMQMAKKALENLSTAIPDHNRFGVLTVTSNPSWVIRPSDPRNRSNELEAISRIYAWGPGINLYSGLLAAFDEISTLDSEQKHILVFLDTADVDEYQVADRGTVWELLRDFNEQRISVSLIGFGNPEDDHIPQLNRFAEKSGGYFYLSSDIEEIPGFGLTDLEQISENLLNFRAEKVRYFSSDFPELESLPDLAGQVITTLKPSGTLYAWSDQELPLFAAWDYGKGKVAVFNADSGFSLAKEWTAGGNPKPWISLLAKLLEPEKRGPELFFSGDTQTGTLFAAPAASGPRNRVQAKIRFINGTSSDLEMQKVGIRNFASPIVGYSSPIRTLEVSSSDRDDPGATSTLSLIPEPSVTKAPSQIQPFNPRSVEIAGPDYPSFHAELFRLLILFIVLVIVLDELFQPPGMEED